ncbi:hypothetical protein CRE_06094 [Caenorhabditis remanei]|uniref:Uncharacterized protein n=1 Tax=Caenorhabditis remanei TaxID=31234 RepID=E3NB07_CAERE|nr:hypothetical protein CRE_06094 [Caenorhabditis remanei]
MPPETFDPIPVTYQNIRGVSFYINFEYKLNWVTPMTIVDLLLNIIGTLIFIQIPIFYLKNKQKIKKNGLRLDVFQSFLLMQIWNISMLIGKFLMFRLPFTGIFTDYCAASSTEIYSVFLSLDTLFLSIIYIIMIYYLLPPFIIFPILASTPHLVTEGLCQQMPQPSPFGAVLLISRFNLDHKVETAFVTLGFTAIVTFTIIGLNISMFWKICKRKKLPAAGQSKSIQNQKVSKTLTGTMIIMLIPLIIYLLSAASEFIPNDDFNFIMFFGAIAGDIRVHIVTCYFYFTHPVFKKQGMTRKVDVTQRVTVN